MAETRYAACGDLSLAYQLFGDGDIDILVAGSFVSHVELLWSSPEFTRFFDRLASFARVALFDKAGVGLSDPVPKVRTLEERVNELEAVMDATGMRRPTIFGISEGGPAAMLFAATKPERVRSLVLTGTFAASAMGDWSIVEQSLETMRATMASFYEPEYWVNDEQIERFHRFALAIRDRWGTGEALGYLLPSVTSRLQLGAMERMSASPGMARATAAAAMSIDVRSVLSSITVPTLIVHASDDFIPVQMGRYLADHIDGARLIELEGSDHAPWLTAPEQVLLEIERFLTGAVHAPSGRRAVRSIVFTDVVDSTRRAAELGDERWRALLTRFDAVTRETVSTFGGTVLKFTGDGHLLTADGPAMAIRSAEALRDAARDIGLDVRIGVHSGECEIFDDDIAGMAVVIAARVMAVAGPGEILVSSTVRDLVVGSGITFDDRGVHDLKGVPGSWTLLAVHAGDAAKSSPEAALAALPTPGPLADVRRSDRALVAINRHAPRVTRALVGRMNRRRPAVQD